MKAAKSAKTAQVDPRRSAYILLICFVAIAGGALEATFPKVTVAACALVILAIVLHANRKWVLRGSPALKIFKVVLLLALTAALTLVATILFAFLSIVTGGLTF